MLAPAGPISKLSEATRTDDRRNDGDLPVATLTGCAGDSDLGLYATFGTYSPNVAFRFPSGDGS